MRRGLRWAGVVLAVALAFAVGANWSTIVRPPLVVGQDAVTDAASATVVPVVETVGGGRAIHVPPPPGVAVRDVLVVIYPGGLVRPQAYEWLARVLAVRGYETVIPEFSFDLAVTDTSRASALIARYANGRKVVLAGHSLGGAMAAQYVADEQRAGRSPVAGLVLMAAYPPDGADLTGATLRALTLRAANDGVADPAKVTGGMSRLPSGSREIVITGSVHSFFGRYGPQAGDGVPTIARAQAEQQILDAVTGLLADLA